MKKNAGNRLLKHERIKWHIAKTICGIAILILLCTTCKVGLGESVDILPPELTITYPSPLEKIIIRDAFVMTGTVSDDTMVSKVHISFAGKENGIQYKHGPYIATLDAANKTWVFTLNTPDTTSGKPVFPIKDAVYTVTVTAYDNSGRSASVTADYEIDNTAPVVIMQQPGEAEVLKDGQPTIIPEAYGTLLKIAGQASDANIDELTFTAFDKDKVKLESETIALGGHTIKANLSEFGDAFYTKIYGVDSLDGEKEFFYTVQASDKAREYNPSGGSIETTGNLSTEYYLFDETSGIVSADKLHSILTGEYYTDRTTGIVVQTSKDESDEILKQLIPVTIYVPDSENTGRDLGRFTLDPRLNPSFSLVGQESVSKDKVTDLLDKKISTSSPITVELSPNKDGIRLDGTTITIRALQLKLEVNPSDPSKKIVKLVPDPEDSTKMIPEYENAYRLYPFAGITPEPSGRKFTFNLTQMGVEGTVEPVPTPDNPQSDGDRVGLPSGSAYILEVTGKDIEGNEYYIFDKYYGFFIEGSGQPPRLAVTQVNGKTTESNAVQVKGGEDVTFKGTVTSDADSVDKGIILSYKLYIDTPPDHPDVTLSVTDTSKGWEFPIPFDKFDEAASNTYTLEITATDADAKSTIQEFLIYYDVEKPDFTADYLSYTVDADKKITVHGTSSDDDRIAFYSYDVKVDSTVKIPSTADVATTGRFNFSFETKDLVNADGSIPANTTVDVIVKDRVGNETTASLTLDSTAPVISALTHSVEKKASDAAISNKRITVTGTASDNGIGIASYSYVVKIGNDVKKPTFAMPESNTIISTAEKIEFFFETKDLVNADGSIPDGTTVEVIITVYDALGNKVIHTETVDTHVPTLGVPSFSPGVVSGTIWYNSAVLTASITATDTGSGVTSVEWSTVSGKWNHLVRGAETQSASGTYAWTGNIPVESGTHTISFRATDGALNVSEIKELEVKIDRSVPVAPTFASVTPAGGTLSTETTQFSNGSAAITVNLINIKDNEGGSGVATVRLLKIGSTTFEEGTSASATHSVPFKVTTDATTVDIKIEIVQLPATASGGVLFLLTDNVGNVTEFTAFTLTVDQVAPSLTLSHSVAKNPIVTSGSVAAAQNNKTVTVTGNASDNTQLAVGGSYVVSLKNTMGTVIKKIPADDATVEEKNKYTFDDAGKIVFAFDTKDIANADGSVLDGTTVEIEVIVKDRAGNENKHIPLEGKFRTIVLDSIAPILPEAQVTTSPSWIAPALDSTKWYNSAVLEVQVTAKDDAPANATASGVTSVEWSTVAGTWNQMLRGSGDIWAGNIAVANGVNNVYFRATDASQNQGTIGVPLVVHVDLEDPTTLSLTSVDGDTSVVNKLSNGEAEISVIVNGETGNTGGSGIKNVRLHKIGSTTFADSSPVRIESNSTTITLLEAQVAAGTNGGVVFRLTDNVGNYTDFTLFTMTIDKEGPTAIINEPANNAEVNGSITIKGNASDNQALASVVLQRKEGSDWTSFGAVVGTHNWTYILNTANLTDNADVILRAKVTDTAGNVRYSSEHTIKVNQDSDRPIIRLSNLNLAGMTGGNNVWLKNSRILYGTVTDDDGIDTFKISIDGGKTYTAPTTFSSGSWSHTMPTDGTVRIFFEVKDTKGATFTSRVLDSEIEGLQTSPKLEDSQTPPNQFGYTNSGNKGSSINLRIDTEPPAINTAIHIDTTPNDSTNDWFDDLDLTQLATNMKLGGTIDTFSLRIEVTDANGIASVQIFNDETELATAIKKSTNANVSVFITPVIDTKLLPNDYVVLTIKATDGAGVETSITRQIIVDNKPPTIAISTPASNEQVTGIVEIRGTTDDGTPASGFKSIQYLIPKRNATNDGWVIPTVASTWIPVSASGLTWNLRFEEDSAHDMLKAYANATYGVETSTGSKIWKVPILFRIEDKLGNVQITKATDYLLWVDPDGDKPKATVTYPLDSATLGGSIRIFGTAEDNIAVQAVYIQIDTNNDGNFDDTDKTALVDMKKIDGSTSIYSVETIGINPTAWWGIKVTGTNSWNTTLNASGEFDPATADVNKIKYRVRAVDDTYLAGEWTTPIEINVDKNAPKIGSEAPLQLVQRQGNVHTGTIIATQDYVEDMWIKGTWYLVGSIEDESGISTVTLSGDLTGNQSNDTLFTKNNSYVTDKICYDMNIPVGDTNVSDNIKFTITVHDNSIPLQSATRQISINRDNVAPTVEESLKHGGQGSEINMNNTVQQSDKTFTFGSTATETGSGFSHIAFWFERNVSTADRIYNVMEERTGDANRTNLNTLSADNGIPRLILTGVTRTTEDALQHVSINNNKNVRKGGLVKIGGVDRFITNVDYNTGTVTFSPSVATSYTTAEIAYVMVVNNQTIETLLQNGTIANDDGDGMVESVERSGGNYAWTASIDSRNIPDGPINIKYVAFDKAGNASAVKVVASKVENNKPAIAKVWLGTDFDGDGTMDGEIAYSTLVNEKPTSDATVDALSTTSGSTKFTAKGRTFVTPEIVGGNGNLYYSLAVDGNSIIPINTASGGTGIRTGEYIGSTNTNGELIDVKTAPIVLTLEDGKLLGLDDTTFPAGRDFVFTIWDSTEETTPGTDSQKAKLTVKMHVDAVDDVVPKTVISPFYWTSEADNSLYDDSLANGHIELKGDLPTGKFTDNNIDTLLDRDPKVSGKISLRGTAYDNKNLTEIWATIDDFTFPNGLADGTAPSSPSGMVKLAQYTPDESGAIPWTVSSATMVNDGWEFTVKSNTLGQNGHSISWQLDWDSQKLTGVAGLDKTVTIISKDAANNYTSTVDTADNKPKYRMDIVPYISGVTTALSSIDGLNPETNSRTALGNYPVYASEEVMMTGFNMSDTTKVFIGDTEFGGLNGAQGSLMVNVGSTATSGEVRITVNNVESLNNINSDVAEYNQTPISTNGHLVDNVTFDVWENKSIASPIDGRIAQPELRVNPDGKIGLSYVNGNFTFNMPKTYGGFVREQEIEASYGLYYESAMAFDPQGNVYALSTNQDIGVGYSAFTTFYFDGKNPSLGKDANYRGGIYRRRIMSTTTKASPQLASPTRVVSPSMAATLATPTSPRSNSNRSNVYFAYYDELTTQIRYQWGTIGSTLEESVTHNGDTIRLDAHGFEVGEQVTFTGSNNSHHPDWNNVYYVKKATSNTFNVSTSLSGAVVTVPAKATRVSAIGGQIMDITGGWSSVDNSGAADLHEKNYTLLAGTGSVTNRGAGQYVSLDAMSGKGAYDAITNPASDMVVITWFDATTRNLMYAYNGIDPQSDDSSNWTTDVIESSAGWYNTVKIDSDGNAHIAYYSISGADLKYVKLDYANGTYTKGTPVVVDSYQLTGTQIRLDVAKSTIGAVDKQVPYISYYAPATQTAKLAYQIQEGAGAIADKFTGNWEVSNVPTASFPKDDTINIGIHKKNGVLTKITDAVANDTINPVVAYVIQEGGVLEMAQKK